MRLRFLLPALIAFGLSACGKTEDKGPAAQLFNAGEKVKIGNLIYSLVDTEIVQRLGDDPTTARTPENRFIILHLTVFNSGNDEQPIPGVTLVSDSGQTYNELSDGSGVQDWMGMVRKVAANQTESGTIVFDAPTKHYRVRLTDEFSPDISIDMPVTFMHEQLEHMKTQTDAPDPFATGKK